MITQHFEGVFFGCMTHEVALGDNFSPQVSNKRLADFIVYNDIFPLIERGHLQADHVTGLPPPGRKNKTLEGYRLLIWAGSLHRRFLFLIPFWVY